MAPREDWRTNCFSWVLYINKRLFQIFLHYVDNDDDDDDLHRE